VARDETPRLAPNDRPASGGDLVQRTALVISAVTSPFVVIAVTATLIVLLLHPPLEQLLLWTGITVLCTAVVPFVFVYQLWRRGRISDIHVAIREQRFAPFVAALVSTAAGMVALYAVGAPRQLVALGCVYLAVGSLLTLISLRWKISMHCAVLASCLVALALIGYPHMLYALLSLPLVIWARVQRQRHTVAQCLVPVLIGLVIPPLVYWGALTVIA